MYICIYIYLYYICNTVKCLYNTCIQHHHLTADAAFDISFPRLWIAADESCSSKVRQLQRQFPHRERPAEHKTPPASEHAAMHCVLKIPVSLKESNSSTVTARSTVQISM